PAAQVGRHRGGPGARDDHPHGARRHRGLLAVKIALVEGRYMRACNEIISLMAYQPLLQGRVYYNLVKVLQEELLRGQGGSG
ncbi:MAG: hypothetical protein H5T99_13875, partial [Moorella sp. (in: Bacteria)]|nr:hypothetical protein [Moorella sp. (in: firmicutes)]